MKQIVLIDGKWLAYRMHFSHLNLSSGGRPTGMLHGFLGELLRINRKLPEARILICWDGEGKTWRHKEYTAYKANRAFNSEYEKMLWQTQQLLPLLQKLGMWVLRLDDVEADDMIGMVATNFATDGNEVRIHSKDHDMFQLVSKHISIWPDVKLPPLKKKEVEIWLGAPLEAFLDIRAMAGDPGDGLKGLPGVGLKTAAKLWKQGFRVTAKSTNSALVAKYKKDWVRVQKELRMARIITDPLSEVWTESTSKFLVHLLYRVRLRPERNVKVGEQNKRIVYEFLAKYELNELLMERHKLFRLP